MKRWVILFGAMAACGGEHTGGPAPVDPVVVGQGGGGAGGGGGSASAPVERTVIERNPFGNVAAADNLLWDGDFEWRSPFADQYGWLSGSGSFLSYQPPALALAQDCRSGLKCAAIPAGGQIAGLALGSRRATLSVSFWARPESGVCDDVVGVVSDLGGGPQRAVAVSAQENAWCRFEGVVPDSGKAPFLFIRNQGSKQAIVDDAVIVPLDTEGASWVPSPEVSLPEMAALRAAAKKASEPRLTPPGPAQRAFEDHLRRLTRGRR